MKKNNHLPEHKIWWKIRTPVWLSTILVAVFCITMTVIACITVTSDDNARVEYKIKSDRFCEMFNERKVYWRVKPADIPRWKRFANRWHQMYWVESFKSYRYPYDEYRDAKKYTGFPLEEFQEVKKTCSTVGDVKEFLRSQEEEFQRNSKEMKRKREKEEYDKMWKSAVE